MTFALSDHQRLVILSGCVGIVGLVLFITVCLVCPFCWINKRIMKKAKKHDPFLHNAFQMSLVGEKGDPPPPYESPRNSTNPGPLNRISVNSFGSNCSDTESVTGIPLPIMSDAELAQLDIPEHPLAERGSVSITLHYKRITSDDKKIFPQLRVDLKEACDLQFRAYGGRCNPYFVIGLYDVKSFSKKRRKRSTGPVPAHEFLSTVVKKNQHPVYHESFFFPLDPSLLKKSVLRLEAWDQDALVNDTALGECLFSLKDVAGILAEENSKEVDLQLQLEEVKVNNGQLLLGLCYLPTAERMTIAVLKANGLKNATEVPESRDFYVQAMAIYSGKIFERRKTSRRPLTPFPVFNEMLMFDVPHNKLDQVTLLMAIYRTNDIENNHQPTSKKNLCIGKVVIGSNGRKHSLNHWNAMRHSPRRQVIQWHELR